MTMPVAAESPVPLRRRERVTARLAVAFARPLSGLPPRRLRRALELARRGARPASADRALRARQAVVTVSARCAGQGCLQRSVATALLCRLYGRWPDWCTGVRVQPFRAHAWVEVDGRAVGESGDTTLFRTVLSVRARSGR
ncbi:lasso peptide biosynthesis B2 protein [Streptomyces ziwulingensis]|uniref:Microcin J25-processing protein McjB C-terminal domain-containing protein n=1 Tax=Streptomyces ziwulingensis TaxID=1045501 RepID=A0ABP9BY09_9ACTN